MGTINISLSDALQAFVDEQMAERGFGSSSEFVVDLIRKEQDRQRLRGLLLEGVASKPTSSAGPSWLDRLRAHVAEREE